MAPFPASTMGGPAFHCFAPGPRDSHLKPMVEVQDRWIGQLSPNGLAAQTTA